MMTAGLHLNGRKVSLTAYNYAKNGYHTITIGEQYGSEVTLFLSAEQLLDISAFINNYAEKIKKKIKKAAPIEDADNTDTNIIAETSQEVEVA